MRKIAVITLAAVLATSVLALGRTNSRSSQSQGGSSAQSSSQPSDQNQRQQSQSAKDQNNNGQQKASGKVSDNGKTFTDQNNKSYTVSNPSALKDYDNQNVSVIMAIDPDTNTIHIVQVLPSGPQN